MSVPGVVQSTLGDEQVAAQVSLGSEDQLFVTPTRTIIYRGDGLLSDEAVEEYSHDADRIEVSTGRRKARITLFQDIDGERSFTVPPKRLDDTLHPVLAGVLNAAGVTEPGETVKRTFRFSELTVIVTSRRLLKHIGEAVWDTDYEEYHYENATGLTFEEGSVATQVVLEVDGRRERIKAPNDQAPELRAELEEALLNFYDVASIAEFERATNPETDEEPEPAGMDTVGDTDDADDGFGGGVTPLDVSQSDSDDRADDVVGGATGDQPAGTADAGATEPAADEVSEAAAEQIRQAAAEQAHEAAAEQSGPEATPAKPAEETPKSTAEPATEAESERVDPDVADEAGVSNEELAERLDDLTAAVKQQNELLETHAQTIEQLIEELKRMQ